MTILVKGILGFLVLGASGGVVLGGNYLSNLNKKDQAPNIQQPENNGETGTSATTKSPEEGSSFGTNRDASSSNVTEASLGQGDNTQDTAVRSSESGNNSEASPSRETTPNSNAERSGFSATTDSSPERDYDTWTSF
ncbi:hypothetical protein [Mycoplasma suis]|uniref:Uncharacterized protein n=3 Tax=Mycoplasma suis TaxID=57372 RepID=F0QRL3_MYCSL|nr:hypothetical protein [Mycoplasma suis]ADX98133.1 hypothetical protein MSU_0601 [Mycoplasma suis str. Illinois]CBZ40655.1 hypothetical protein MSUIS_05620 [Mycoplasma suis KI3806]